MISKKIEFRKNKIEPYSQKLHQSLRYPLRLIETFDSAN